MPIPAYIDGDLRVQFLSDSLVRIERKGPKGFEDRPTFTVVGRRWSGTPYRKQGDNLVAKGYTVALNGHDFKGIRLVDLTRLALAHEAAEPTQLAAHTRIVAHFRAAIEEHYRTNLGLKQYCDRIGTTLGRLRIACRAVACATPGQLIADRLILEAKRCLRYSDLPVSEIAYSLGFEDPAYFSRYFARATGATPSAFRRAP